MSNVAIFSGKKHKIPRKYLSQILTLLQQNNQELLQTRPPAKEFYKRQLILSQPSDSKKEWVIAINADDEVVGYGYLSWNVKYDNLDKGNFWLYVKQSERRKGIGTAMLKEITQLVPEQITTLTTNTFSSTKSEGFIKQFKERESYTEIISISDLTRFNLREVAAEAKRQREAASKKGYDIIYIENLDFMFHLDLEEYVKMLESIWADMPQEDLHFEDERLPVERFLEMYQRSMFLGFKSMNFVAVEKKTGLPVGLTNTLLNQYQPHVAIQEDTGVLKEHRGNGLGLAMKYQMLEKLLKETEAEQWQTGNAGSNKYMLRINQQLHYEPKITLKIYELTSQELKNKLHAFSSGTR